MMINLEKFVEKNEKIKELEEEKEFQEELRNIVASIIQGDETYETNSDKLVEELNFKVKKTKSSNTISLLFGSTWCSYGKDYTIKLNKTNIKKVQDYINKED